jgi:hypothetical protein
VHDAAEVGIGLNNPTAGAAPTASTVLNVNTTDPGFDVKQAVNQTGVAIRGFGSETVGALTGGPGVTGQGGGNGGTESGGIGVLANGGSLSAPLTGSRLGGAGMFATGGDGGASGGGGDGVNGLGGGSTTDPGDGGVFLGGSKGSAPQAGAGVSGFGGLGPGPGVQFAGKGVVGASTSNFGVEGVSLNSTGVRGQSGSNYGIYGQSSTAVGIRGVSFGATAAGVEGVASGAGPGVWGFATSGHAVLGNSTTGNGGVFAGKTGITTTGSPNALVANGNVRATGTGHFDGGIVISSRFADGVRRATYGVTSPDSVIEDFGRARLMEGRARVELDASFVAVMGSSDYAVFPVPTGDCNGLYVAAKSSDGFEVRELRGGTSTLDFDYRVVAKRSGSAARFARVDDPEAPRMPPLPTPAPTEPGDGLASIEQRARRFLRAPSIGARTETAGDSSSRPAPPARR